MALRASGAILTDPGRVRDSNEDAVAFLAPGATGRALAIVADGMGGHAAGEVASRLAVETVVRYYQERNDPTPVVLAEAMRMANHVIHQHATQHRECKGMGTTCTAIAVDDDCAYLAHVGDSRAYLFRAGTLHQVSEDDSLVAALVRDGTITAEQATNHTGRNLILKSLGTRPDVRAMIWQEGFPLLAGDALVLCSDGLTDMVDDRALAAVLQQFPPYEACLALIDAANCAGGHDNISVGVIALAEATSLASPKVLRDTRSISIPSSGEES